jgi:hypothetical protein
VLLLPRFTRIVRGLADRDIGDLPHGAQMSTCGSWAAWVGVTAAAVVRLVAALVAVMLRCCKAGAASDVAAKLTRHVSGALCLDESRQRLVDTTGLTLQRLVNGELVGRDGYRLLLLGRKGVGKTCLLRALQQAAARELGAHGLRCAWVDYSNAVGAQCPMHAALSSLGWAWWALSVTLWVAFEWAWRDTVGYVRAVEGVLAALGMTMFVVIDEAQNAFHSRCPRGGSIINELQVIGASSRGVTHWIMSGSSSHLRGLITGNAVIADMHSEGFVHYARDNINGRKFVPIPIFPFLDSADFTDLVARMTRGRAHAWSIANLYLRSGGRADAVRALLDDPNAVVNEWANSARGLGGEPRPDNAEAALLSSLLATLNDTVEVTSEDDLTLFASWSLQFDASHVMSRVSGHTQRDLLGACYSLSDRGIVRYSERVALTPARLGFGGPIVALDLWSSSESLTAEELIALRHCNRADDGAGDLAGDVALRCIAQAARRGSSAEALGFRVRSTTAQPAHVPSLCVGRGASPLTPGSAAGVMWREVLTGNGRQRDALGADGVVLVGEGHDRCAHRIQVKLGDAAFTIDKARTACDRLSTMRAITQEAYADVGLPLGRQRFIVATTKPVPLEVAAVFRERGVVVWDRAFLAAHVWSPAVQLIHRRFRS